MFIDRGLTVYQDRYGEQPDLTLQSNSDGVAVLPPAPWSDPTWRKRDEPTTLILRARASGDATWGYAFLPIFDLNRAYIRGDRKAARIPVAIDLK